MENLILKNGEDLLAPAAAFHALGLRVSPATITRYILHGFHGVKLESVRCGKYRFISIEGLRRFLAATSSTAPQRNPGRRAAGVTAAQAPSHRAAAIDAARAYLREGAA